MSDISIATTESALEVDIRVTSLFSEAHFTTLRSYRGACIAVVTCSFGLKHGSLFCLPTRH
jgi:hypothetical protein